MRKSFSARLLARQLLPFALVGLVYALVASELARPPAAVPQSAKGVAADRALGDLRVWWPASAQPGAASDTTARSWAHDATPREALAALQARSGAPLVASWHTRTGVPSFLTTQDGLSGLAYTPSALERGKPVAIAQGFLDENRALWGLTSAAEQLALLRVEPDPQLGFAHVRLAQHYHGLPVWGRQLVVHIDKQERVVAVNGQFEPAIAVPTEPTLSKQVAEAEAVREITQDQLEEHERAAVLPTVVADKTELVVHVDAWGKARLTWAVTVMTKQPLGQWRVFVNARRARTAHAYDASEPIKRRITYSADNTTRLPGRRIIDEGERSNDEIAQAAHDGAGTVYDYYFNKFQRDSIDGQGLPLVSTVHYGSDPQDAENAAWIGELQQMIYGDGGRIFRPLPFGLDVVGHEFTHGIIDSSAGLIYEAQSGALNESYADVFGALIDRGNWVVGEAVVKSPPFPVPYIRSLEDPNAGGLYDPNNPLQGVGQPATMDEYANLPVSRRADNGGVHINSGIPNRAAFLLQQQIGPDQMEQIYYRAMTQYLTPDSQFVDAANATVQAATELFGQPAADAARNAFGQVGIPTGGGEVGGTPPPAGPDQVPVPEQPQPPPPPVPEGCTDVVVNGGFENQQGWVQVVRGDTNLIDPELPRTGNQSAWLGGTDQEGVEALMYIYQDVSLPPNAATVQLRYYRLLHRELKDIFSVFASEARFSAVVANTNGDVVATIEEASSAQANDQWEEVTIDASRFAGRTIRLVYAQENPRGNVSSTFIDDVALIACTQGATPPQAPPTASQEEVFLQGTITDADTGRGIEGAQIFIMQPGVSASRAARDDALDASEVLTLGVTDRDGVYQSEVPVQRNQVYSAIVIAPGYRPIVADNGVEVPPDATNPYPVDATLRRGR